MPPFKDTRHGGKDDAVQRYQARWKGCRRSKIPGTVERMMPFKDTRHGGKDDAVQRYQARWKG